jgi:hypothetical protein
MTEKLQTSSSIEDLCARHHISRDLVFAAIRKGELKVTRLGTRCLRITQTQEAEWLELCANRGPRLRQNPRPLPPVTLDMLEV